VDFIDAVIIAIIEGITEFLPISSTGHMVITQWLLGLDATDPFLKAFTVNIQFGAILSVVVLYWRRFLQSIWFYVMLLVAFIPTAFFGYLLNDAIDNLLESVHVVAVALLIGGIILLFVDKWFTQEKEVEITYGKAFFVGLIQCISMIPGVSRSAATIIGGMSQGMTRKQAAEFSFFLAVPTMFAASAYKLLKGYKENPLVFFDSDRVQLLILGNLVAFFVAMLAIRFFINVLNRYGFRAFGWYRIAVGALLLILWLSGVSLEV
jgi:undecaprenyl-diphosphatase